MMQRNKPYTPNKRNTHIGNSYINDSTSGTRQLVSGMKLN